MKTPPLHDAEGISAISRWLSEATPPEHRMETTRIPEGCQPTRSSVQIPIFVFHACFLQKLHQLLAKRLHTMMLGLVRDVFLHLRPRRRADGESPVSFLPRKLAQPNLFMHPDGRCLLQLPHEIRQAVSGLQPHQQMHMIGYAADTLGIPAKSSHGASEVFVKAISPCDVDERSAILRGENDVVMQSKERRGHNDTSWLASLRDAGLWRIVSGGIALLNHRLMALNPSGS